jgi:hypothetical protein
MGCLFWFLQHRFYGWRLLRNEFSSPLLRSLLELDTLLRIWWLWIYSSFFLALYSSIVLYNVSASYDEYMSFIYLRTVDMFLISTVQTIFFEFIPVHRFFRISYFKFLVEDEEE